ncbi:MAG: hypothetical protein IT184_12480 [Acidobacteria bacterium]|nr:hypothetical protein [Acidobacteriota bacterium]
MPSAAEREQNVTVTGCLIQGSNPDTFLLENAKTSSGGSISSSARPSSGSASQPGASSSSMSSVASAGQTYVIDGATSLNLKTQVNHQVTIIGTVASAAGSSIGSPSSSGAGYGSAGSSSANPGSSAGSMSAPSSSSSSSASAHHDESKLARLTAKSVTKISDTCSSAD